MLTLTSYRSMKSTKGLSKALKVSETAFEVSRHRIELRVLWIRAYENWLSGAEDICASVNGPRLRDVSLT